MMQVLLSIKPEYVERILNGTKRYEYRKFRIRPETTHLLIYETAPVMKIVAQARIAKVIEAPFEQLWQQTKDYAGINYSQLKNYFADRTTAYAIELADIRQLAVPLTLADVDVSHAPQSCMYVKKDLK